MLNNSQRDCVRRLYRRRYNSREIAALTGYDLAEIQKLVKPPRESVAHRLIREGCDPKVVAANFGEAAVR